MKEYEIWEEGFAATGERAGARFIGKAMGETFEEACKNFRYPADIVRSWDGMVLVHKGDALKLDEHYPYPSIWACRLYDNEADARRSFG